MSNKKPVPPALAEFALEQLAEAGEQAAIDLTVQNVEILRARIAELEAPMLAWAELDYTKHTRRSLMCYIGQQNFRITAQENQLAALKTQPSAGVVLPERMVKTETSSDEYDMCADTHNACLDEVARLNQPCDGVNWKAVAGEQKTIIEGLQARLNQPCECVAVPRELLEHVIHARRELTRMDRAPLHIRQKLAQKLTDMIAQQGKAVGDE